MGPWRESGARQGPCAQGWELLKEMWRQLERSCVPLTLCPGRAARDGCWRRAFSVQLYPVLACDETLWYKHGATETASAPRTRSTYPHYAAFRCKTFLGDLSPS